MENVTFYLRKLWQRLLLYARRFGAWWKKTFQSQSSSGKILFGSVSLLISCCLLFCLCSVPLVIFTPSPTETPAESQEELAQVSLSETPISTEALSTNTPELEESPTATDTPPATETPELVESPTNTQPPPTATPRPPTNTPKPSSTPLHPPGQEATVSRIVDGDTIDVSIDGTEYTIRYIGMDTPERGMPFFDEATAANADLVEGQTIILVKDVSETDRYNRLLRYVYLLDGTFVNAELVKQGYAQSATYPPDVAHEEIFNKLMQEARVSELGLWASPPTKTPAPPTNTPMPLPTNTSIPLPTNTIPPPPPPTNTPEPPPPPPPAQNCDPGYIGVCIQIGIGDYDCAGGSGNGPNYVQGPFQVVGPDPHGLDGDNDGWGCE